MDDGWIARYSARALYAAKTGDNELANQAHAEIIERLEDTRFAFDDDTDLDLFDNRYNARYEAAIRYFLETEQSQVALRLIDRTRFRSGCDARQGRLRFGSPFEADASSEPPFAPDELVLVEWLYPSHEWSLTYSSRGNRPEQRRITIDEHELAEVDVPAEPAWFRDFARGQVRLQHLVNAHADLLDGFRRLTIIPHGRQWQAPWSALDHPLTGRALSDTHEVMLLPSMRWGEIEHRHHRDTSSRASLVIGDPTNDLPEARAEARNVAERLGTTPILGSDASVEVVQRALTAEPYAVIHYAGHGVFNKHGLVKLTLADGSLAAESLGGARINADLLYLGSCWSGTSEFSVWNELHGFLRAALVGGTRHIVSANFPIGSAVAEIVSDSFYDRYLRLAPDGSTPAMRPHPATALRSAISHVSALAPVETWGGLFVTGDHRPGPVDPDDTSDGVADGPTISGEN